MRSVPKDYAEAETTSNRLAERPALNWRKNLRVLEGAYSANTIRAYRSDFAIFVAWCDARNQPSLPASPKTVADFLRDQSASAKSATISRRRAAISRVHRLLKLANPAPMRTFTWPRGLSIDKKGAARTKSLD
jgi:site-specific recombinase XerD